MRSIPNIKTLKGIMIAMKSKGQGARNPGHEASYKVSLAINMIDQNQPIPVNELFSGIDQWKNGIGGNILRSNEVCHTTATQKLNIMILTTL